MELKWLHGLNNYSGDWVSIVRELYKLRSPHFRGQQKFFIQKLGTERIDACPEVMSYYIIIILISKETFWVFGAL